MPEGPELFLSAKFINKVSHGRLFSGKVTKSEVSIKNPDVDWNYPTYTIHAQSRGKELRLSLYEVVNESEPKEKRDCGQSMDILFHFGMSGKFEFTSTDEMHKHAHLHFHSKDDKTVLSFVDTRRFGRWMVNAPWSDDRGPCVIQEKERFRSNVLDNLKDVAFNRPICEVMLNQKYFNGIGNYLRAEILYRLRIAPFDCARDVLEPLTLNVKREEDILDLCHSLPVEVTELDSTAYFQESSTKDYSAFENWLRCYNVDGMENMSDHNKRTIWFTGKPGPLAPKEQKTKKAVKRKTKAKGESDSQMSSEDYRDSEEFDLKPEVDESIDYKPKTEKLPRGIKAEERQFRTKARVRKEVKAKPREIKEQFEPMLKLKKDVKVKVATGGVRRSERLKGAAE